MNDLEDETNHVLGQSDVYPVGSKLPHIEHEHIDGFRKRNRFFTRLDLETQNHVAPIPCFQRGRRIECLPGGLKIGGPGLVLDGNVPDKANQSISKTGPGATVVLGLGRQIEWSLEG